MEWDIDGKGEEINGKGGSEYREQENGIEQLRKDECKEQLCHCAIASAHTGFCSQLYVPADPKVYLLAKILSTLFSPSDVSRASP